MNEICRVMYVCFDGCLTTKKRSCFMNECIKKRWYNHTRSFRDPALRKATSLAKIIHRLKKVNIWKNRAENGSLEMFTATDAFIIENNLTKDLTFSMDYTLWLWWWRRRIPYTPPELFEASESPCQNLFWGIFLVWHTSKLIVFV